MLQIRSRLARAIPGLVLSAALASTAADAKPDGSITGRSVSSTPGCGNCHGNESANTTVTVAGPASVQKGSTNKYTVTITGGGSVGGVNIKASSGQLALEAGDTSLKLVGSELSHTAPKPASGGNVVFTFNLVAPNEDKAILLTAVGNSANGDNTSQGDEWNFALPLNVAAGTPTEGPEEDIIDEGCSASGSASLGFAAFLLLALAFFRRPAYQRLRKKR